MLPRDEPNERYPNKISPPSFESLLTRTTYTGTLYRVQPDIYILFKISSFAVRERMRSCGVILDAILIWSKTFLLVSPKFIILIMPPYYNFHLPSLFFRHVSLRTWKHVTLQNACRCSHRVKWQGMFIVNLNMLLKYTRLFECDV